MKAHMTLEFWRDDGWYVGRIKEIPGVFSQGESLKELEANIIDAYKMILSESATVKIPRNAKKKELAVSI